MEVKPPPEIRDVHSEIILQDDSGSNRVESSEDLHQEGNNVSTDVENKVEIFLEKSRPQQKNESNLKEVLQKAKSDQVDTKMKTVQGEKSSLKKESRGKYPVLKFRIYPRFFSHFCHDFAHYS